MSRISNSFVIALCAGCTQDLPTACLVMWFTSDEKQRNRLFTAAGFTRENRAWVAPDGSRLKPYNKTRNERAYWCELSNAQYQRLRTAACRYKGVVRDKLPKYLYWAVEGDCACNAMIENYTRSFSQI